MSQGEIINNAYSISHGDRSTWKMRREKGVDGAGRGFLFLLLF